MSSAVDCLDSRTIHSDPDHITNRHRLAFETIIQLSRLGIRLAVSSGAHVELLANHRQTSDVDVLVADEDMDKVVQALPEATLNTKYDSRIYEYEGIEFISHMNIWRKDGRFNQFRLTDLAMGRVALVGELKIPCLDVVDTALWKLILGRGVEEGKHDLFDVKELLKVAPVDQNYLRRRAEEIGVLDELQEKFWQLSKMGDPSLN